MTFLQDCRLRSSVLFKALFAVCVFIVFAHSSCMIASQPITENGIMQTQQMDEDGTAPTFLYKVLSVDDWQASQGQEIVKLSVADHDFIHLAKEDQLERITDKFWGNAPEYVVLKIRTDVLPGKLIYEANPGGENKYYHLYNGSIPLSSVLEAKIVNAR